MPRKKTSKQTDGQGMDAPSAKRRKPNQASGATKPDQVPIDYQKLAAEILRQQSLHQPQSTGEEKNQEQTSASTTISQVNTTASMSSQPATSGSQASTAGSQASTSTTQDATSGSQADTTATVSQLVSRIFEGEPAGTAPNKNTSNYIPITDGIPLGATVPNKIKSKIWSNEFIDLRSLLTHQEEDPVTLLITPGVINLQHSQKSKTPLSINQWTDAFLVFTCIVIQQKPTEAPHLLKYMSFIRELQKLHGDSAWRSYDESFRKLRETVDLPWQKPVEELRGKSLAVSTKQSNGQPFRGKQVGRIGGVRFCFAYNQGNKCKSTPCPFTHICQACRGNHPKIKCKSTEKSEHDRTSPNTSKGKQTK
ncbi:uncharacterized protein LOC134252480 [Saccostrea cucullata]|uniref:uncharacterized protein LOC134252480 n=1 Tax=Saccostrea cuccullata TaxID=36930 RepID=UPI002ED4D283